MTELRSIAEVLGFAVLILGALLSSLFTVVYLGFCCLKWFGPLGKFIRYLTHGRKEKGKVNEHDA